MQSTEKACDTTLDDENALQHVDDEKIWRPLCSMTTRRTIIVVTALCNQLKAFASDLGDDQSCYLLCSAKRLQHVVCTTVASLFAFKTLLLVLSLHYHSVEFLSLYIALLYPPVLCWITTGVMPVFCRGQCFLCILPCRTVFKFLHTASILWHTKRVENVYLVVVALKNLAAVVRRQATSRCHFCLWWEPVCFINNCVKTDEMSWLLFCSVVVCR